MLLGEPEVPAVEAHRQVGKKRKELEMNGSRNMLGSFGEWAAGLLGEASGALSFRNARWSDLDEWRTKARDTLTELLRSSAETRAFDVRVNKRYMHDALEIEELSWQLPYGPRTEAIFLKPQGARGRLPGVLAFHDHAGNKFFGKRKIVRLAAASHPMIDWHQREYYGGVAWANEIARRGFAVLVHDTFPFESRKILAADLPGHVVRRIMKSPKDIHELTPSEVEATDSETSYEVPSEEPEERVSAYNAFAAQHESIVAKSLFCAGLTWPGVTFAEDRAALDYLSSRSDIDPGRLSCAGLSGGGLRTVYLAGLDDRIRCAVCAGMMSTWRDFLLNVSYTHTWMIFVPGLAGLLDFPEILGLRAPLPSLVLATTDDPLFTRSEVERAGRILEEVYQKAGARDAFRIHFYPGPHKFDLPMQAEAFGWIESHLKRPG
jgi:dienelactone hydrolase